MDRPIDHVKLHQTGAASSLSEQRPSDDGKTVAKGGDGSVSMGPTVDIIYTFRTPTRSGPFICADIHLQFPSVFRL